MNDIKEEVSFIEIKGLCKYYNKKNNHILKKSYLKAVNNFDISISKGEIFGLVGESGCGKSTLGKMIANIVQPTSGEIIFKGIKTGLLPQKEKQKTFRKIQIVFQDPYSSLNPKKKIGWILEEPLKIHYKLSQNERQKKVAEILKIVGLDNEYKDRFPGELSGGQRQRVCIAAALMLEPEVIIADESVSALDVSIQSQILNLLKELQCSKNLTYIFVSHDLNVVHYISDRIGVMYMGHLVEVGKAEEIYLSPAHPYTRALFSVIPSIESEQERKPVILEGEVSSVIEPVTGCPFEPRCKEALSVCKREFPNKTEISSGHYVFCHQAEKSYKT
ncbi:MAG: ATP-binding cassette domain-containing protein [Spirochaetales bacterium]|nr:ATP-binding cassette domain-containing protein [Spirochaetales bacterium]